MKKNEIFNNVQPSLDELFLLTREWANEKGIYEKGDLKTQALKLVEEVGELSKAILKDDELEIEDAIGDCIVVLINVAELYNKKLIEKNNIYRYQTSSHKEATAENCLLTAYNVIKNRSGKMKNGTFEKQN